MGSAIRTEEKLVELTNGCICCTLREDLVEAVGTLARQGRFDQLVIESTGISEPMPVAATFEWQFEDGFRLGELARLDTMVTVVDASTFLTELARGQALAERDMSAGDGDARNIADLLVDQVEFADVLLLNKTDLVSAARLGAVETLLRRLNPSAKLIRADHGVVDLDEVLDTGLFDPVAAATAPGWDEEIADGHTPPETEEYGIASMTFRADRPFHPPNDWRRRSSRCGDCCAARVSAGSPAVPRSPPSGRRPPESGDRAGAVLVVHGDRPPGAGDRVHRRAHRPGPDRRAATRGAAH